MATTKVPNRQVSLDSRRIRLEREVKIRVPQFDTFVTEYSGNISTTGMFILTNNPKSPGTVFTFEFSVADDWKLIRGQAQVVWVRHRAEGEERPPGMGVRFVELDGQSRRLIRWIVEKHIREGGKPFELEELRSVIDEALDDVLEPGEAKPLPATAPRRTPVPAKTIVQRVTRKRDDIQLVPLLVTAVIVVGLVAALFWLTEYLPRTSPGAATVADAASSGAAAAEDGDAVAAGSEGEAEDEAAAAGETTGEGSASPDPGADPGPDAETAASAPPADPPPVGSAYASVTALLDAWSSAWSEQDVEGYLSLYAADFRPANGIGRASWAAERRERLTRPAYIRIAISGLEMERVDEDRVDVTFFQSYRSDRFSDEVRKRLELAWQDGAWRILREVSL